MPGVRDLVAFGPFELELRSGELRKGQTRIRLQDLPFRVLSILLEQPGEVISRQDLQSRLWGSGTFVDFDHSLNTAVSKLRTALADNASRPRYVETVGRHGYRFIGQITSSAHATAPTAHSSTGAVTRGGLGNEPSIAVLPLANLSADKENDYFSDGLTEEVINALASISGLRVVARTSSFRFKNAAEDVREIGAQLGVRFVLEGSVRRVADRVRVAVQLIKVSDGYHALSRMYDRKLDDIFALQERLAAEVAHELAPHLDVCVRCSHRTANPDAYSAYLQGRHHLALGLGGLSNAASMFEDAIQLDPQFAAAHSGLSDVLLSEVFFGISDPASAMPKAKSAAMEALRLDPKLGEAHVSMALVEFGLEWAWETGFQRLEYARTLLPTSSFATVVYGFWGLTRRGAYDLTLGLMEATVRLDPFNPMVHASTILNLGLAGRYQDAVEHYRFTTNFTTDYSIHRTMAQIHHREGEHERALETLLRAGTPDQITGAAACDALGDFAFAYSIAGRRSDADAVVGLLRQRAAVSYVSPWNRALICSGLGQAPETISALREVAREHSLKVVTFPIDPRLSWLRGYEEFEDLLREVRLV
ncbi:MAG: winged helix-turn-helix domain-containing protein [Bryobacteraceae bacterium]|nr:winged helix-turn-helix domain-containing protein [Bryobacteraceae bacterium]